MWSVEEFYWVYGRDLLGVSLPCYNLEQNVDYNGHKRKHALKYQTITAPDGLPFHAFGTMDGRRYDWALYLQSSIEEQLFDVFLVDGTQYFVNADSGYNR